MNTATPLTQAIAGVVRAGMEARNLSTEQLANATGIAYSTLYRRLLGRTAPFTTTELADIARELGTTVSALTAEAERAA